MQITRLWRLNMGGGVNVSILRTCPVPFDVIVRCDSMCVGRSLTHQAQIMIDLLQPKWRRHNSFYLLQMDSCKFYLNGWPSKVCFNCLQAPLAVCHTRDDVMSESRHVMCAGAMCAERVWMLKFINVNVNINSIRKCLNSQCFLRRFMRRCSLAWRTMHEFTDTMIDFWIHFERRYRSHFRFCIRQRADSVSHWRCLEFMKRSAESALNSALIVQVEFYNLSRFIFRRPNRR